jgi:hypothetical protein
MMTNLAGLVRGHKKEWYQTEKNTSVLLKAILSSRVLDDVSGDDVWNLLRLTWITLSKGQPSRDHWKRLKVLALADLWRQPVDVLSDLKTTVEAMRLPISVTEAAALPTGFVNFYNAWRKSSMEWCRVNRNKLISVIHEASNLAPNDQSRFDLSTHIEGLPRVPLPGRAGRELAPGIILTPLIACLDPSSRFPIINGRAGVRRLLSALYLANRSLDDQVKGMINLIGQFGLSDSFMIDVLATDIIAVVPMVTALPKRSKRPANGRSSPRGKSLPILDEDERQAVQKSATVLYRNRHNKMTNALKKLLKKHQLIEGIEEYCRYDVLIKKYDETNRDLLIEVKPDADKGSIRIAIGQLFDYRRFLPHRAGTDLAILTMTRPQKTFLDLLFDLQISALWFDDELCERLSGEGKVWQGLKGALI